MMCIEKNLINEVGMKEKGGWKVDVVFLVQKVLNLKILKGVLTKQGSNDLD